MKRISDFLYNLKCTFSFLLLTFYFSTQAQAPKTYTSAEILLQLKKIKVLGAVLYIAAHPDDENTRLLSYFANEKLYRTGYLSLTRGDGGQNLIGDEQGVDLGLIRTQELLAARRIDGAEQFFTRAYDFGYSKSPEEAMHIWGHDKILSDVVWVIRKFKPDVIITRFPTTGEGGHGHHTASAVLAEEAFEAAADPTRFPEQLKSGVTTWQAKRLVWNSFNFGSINTQSESHFKLDCGEYNPVLGKSYGEIAAASRSQHKSQGFGVPAQRGSVIEYFKPIKGPAPVNDLMDGVDISWDRLSGEGKLINHAIYKNNTARMIDSIIQYFSLEHPEKSVSALVRLYKKISTGHSNDWEKQKLEEIKKIIEYCSGLFMDATTTVPSVIQGDSLKINLVVNKRLDANIHLAVAMINDDRISFDSLKRNVNVAKMYTLFIKPDAKLTQPYWLENEMEKGSFNVTNQQLIGKGESDPLSVRFDLIIEGMSFTFTKPLRYKFTDPVKGELYQPVSILPKVEVNYLGDVFLAINESSAKIRTRITTSSADSTPYTITTFTSNKISSNQKSFVYQNGKSNDIKEIAADFSYTGEKNSSYVEEIQLQAKNKNLVYNQYKKTIQYDHIPSIVYFHKAVAKFAHVDLKTEGNFVGYIPGAGDKVPEALMQMGYRVVILKESDITASNLKQFDAVITGIRAYNTNEWLNNVYDVLMQYVQEGGVLLVQYNTSNQIGPVRAKISPYPFTISRNRITDEEAKVNFLVPDHPVLNHPNVITANDFEGWIQERSIYHAEKMDSNYQRILSMKDPGENEQDGSLIVAKYGKGRFIYTGLVFFRELPAGVPGAYRLFANLIANKRDKYVK